MKLLLPALVVLVSLLAAPGYAQDTDKNLVLDNLKTVNGILAYDSGDYAAALRELRPVAERGNTDAQYWLGIMYDRGKGIPQDSAEAVRWYRLAAQQGHARAQSTLGSRYLAGGLGVPEDYTKALNWLRKAAEQGDSTSKYSLGVMNKHGLGVPQDYVQAHIWFNLAAAQGVEFAFEDRETVALKMTPADISHAQRMAREWLETHPQ